MSSPARIGPNAVTQLAAALDELASAHKLDIFAGVGAAVWLDAPPRDMVDETAVAALHRRVREDLPRDDAERVLARAGELTADYILAHRIPAPVRALAPLLPSGVSGALLARAVARNAWTFVGSGRFSCAPEAGATFRIAANPLCRGQSRTVPSCCWHEAVFTRLFKRLVHPAAQAIEVECCAAGDDACRFVLFWPGVKTWGQIKARPASGLAWSTQTSNSTPISKDDSLAF